MQQITVSQSAVRKGGTRQQEEFFFQLLKCSKDSINRLRLKELCPNCGSLKTKNKKQKQKTEKLCQWDLKQRLNPGAWQ